MNVRKQLQFALVLVLFSFPAQAASLVIESPAFEEGQPIPKKYTCDGENISPLLRWGPEPRGTESYVLTMIDPDAPSGNFVHWLVYNLPKGSSSAPEGMPTHPELFWGERQGITDFGKPGYGGPCPPSGNHRYYFRIYALDKRLEINDEAKLADVQKAMEAHILAQGELMGRYERS